MQPWGTSVTASPNISLMRAMAALLQAATKDTVQKFGRHLLRLTLPISSVGSIIFVINP
jgi:hypothetical protein